MASGKEKPKKKLRSSYSAVFEIFAGTYVNLVIKNIKGNNKGNITNLVFAGYLLDEDVNHYFLGQTTEEVYAAVRKEEVTAIMISDEIKDLMEQMELPDGENLQ